MKLIKPKLLKQFKGIALFAVVSFLFCPSGFGQSEKLQKWFPKYDLSAVDFKAPAQEFGPFARWWWPGNDVTQEELRREVDTFVDNDFGGVEIQPFAINVPMSSEQVKARVLSWDTSDYYANVRAVLDEAQKRGLIIDMNNGSGWPAGGPHLDTEDGMLTLDYADENFVGGMTIFTKVPAINNETGVPAKLVAVVASKVLPQLPGQRKTTQLDPSSTIVLTENVKNDSISWDAPEGEWTLIAFWNVPSSKTGSMVAKSAQGPVVNHLDSMKVFKNLDYLFGERTGMDAYYGNPLRAIFDDSYEFAVDRHFSNEFISWFKQKRGYDISPWLAANMIDKYNYVEYKNPNKAPRFAFGPEDWRLRYDYDLTVSELFGENFIKAGSNWLEERGMLHRTQAYGMYLDMIANAGLASIPETESMMRQEANLKIMASGAHLYNRPILSAESVVIKHRAYMTTPQKIRLAVDKLFAAGVNQVIYHGVPYKYVTDETTDLGWYPFHMGFIGFSSHLGEGTQFWKYQKEVNQYIARTQYALRSGKAHADVLIYFPFMKVEGTPDNPEEIMTTGYLPDVEPPLKEDKEFHSKEEKELWAKAVYPLINQLEKNGITWEWVNDASIQEAQLDKDKQINIRGNLYQALILAGDTVIQMNSAKQINLLAKEGMKLLAVGELPKKQPSFLHWEKNDELTREQLKDAVLQPNSKQVQEGSDLTGWISELDQPVRFKDQYQFTRQIQREMADGSRVQFIWNKSDRTQLIAFDLDKKYKYCYWLNAEDGLVSESDDLTNASYVLPPYSSIILYASTTKRIDNNLISDPLANVLGAQKVLTVDTWNLKVDTISILKTSLFDWKQNEQLKFTSNEGIYTSTFVLNDLKKRDRYLMDLGKVCFTAEVYVNGKSAGKRIYSPYCLDISSLLQKGENSIEIRVTPGALNGLIGQAVAGNPRYNNFKGQENMVMSGGLIGPVILYKK